MPNPKRRHSKSRRDKRRTHYKAFPATMALCTSCGEVKLPHVACRSCGTYNGRVVLAV